MKHNRLFSLFISRYTHLIGVTVTSLLLIHTNLDAENLFYIRPAKTGSTSVISLLKAEFPEASFYEKTGVYLGNETSWKSAKKKLKKVPSIRDEDIVIGHFPFWFFLKKSTKQQRKEAFWFITMREPVERILSHYRAKLRDHKALTQPWDIEPNGMCRILSSDPTLEGEALLKNAIKNLNQMNLVIFLDDFEWGIEKLCQALGMTIPNQTPRQNPSPDLEFSNEVIRKIAEANELDIQLYNYASGHCRG